MKLKQQKEKGTDNKLQEKLKKASKKSAKVYLD